jgi:hypothetical protein
MWCVLSRRLFIRMFMCLSSRANNIGVPWSVCGRCKRFWPRGYTFRSKRTGCVSCYNASPVLGYGKEGISGDEILALFQLLRTLRYGMSSVWKRVSLSRSFAVSLVDFHKTVTKRHV